MNINTDFKVTMLDGFSKTEKNKVLVTKTNTHTVIEAIKWWSQSRKYMGPHFMIGRDGNIHYLMDVDVDYYKNPNIRIHLVGFDGAFTRRPDGKFFYYKIPNQISTRVRLNEDEVYKAEGKFEKVEYYQSESKDQATALQELKKEFSWKSPQIELVKMGLSIVNGKVIIPQPEKEKSTKKERMKA